MSPDGVTILARAAGLFQVCPSESNRRDEKCEKGFMDELTLGKVSYSSLRSRRLRSTWVEAAANSVETYLVGLHNRIRLSATNSPIAPAKDLKSNTYITRLRVASHGAV